MGTPSFPLSQTSIRQKGPTQNKSRRSASSGVKNAWNAFFTTGWVKRSSKEASERDRSLHIVFPEGASPTIDKARLTSISFGDRPLLGSVEVLSSIDAHSPMITLGVENKSFRRLAGNCLCTKEDAMQEDLRSAGHDPGRRGYRTP